MLAKATNAKKICSLLLAALFLVSVFPLSSYGEDVTPEITAIAEGTVTVLYEDSAGNTIAPSEIYTGGIGEAYTVIPPAIPGYQLSGETITNQATYSGTYTTEEQTIVFLYTVKYANFHTFQSFTLETSSTAMFNRRDLADYDSYVNNVIFYPDAETDTLTGSFANAVWLASSGQSTQILYFPEDQKQLLGGTPQLTVYRCGNNQWPYWLDSREEVMSADELASAGYWITILYSTDRGETFSEAPPEDISATNAIGVKFVMADNAEDLINKTNPLGMIVEFPITVAADKLTADEADGTAALRGWQSSVTLPDVYNFPAATILSSPQIQGTVRRQELPGEEEVNWEQAGSLAGQTVELVDENGVVIAAAVTNENGEYTFDHINTLDKVQVRIKDAEGTVYFSGAGTYHQKDVVPVGGVMDIDRTLERFSNVTWKNSDIDMNAENSWDARFIVVTRSGVPQQSYTVTFDSQGGSSIMELTEIAYGSTIAVPSDPKRSGYVFKGWYKEPSCINAWDFESDAVISDITLYAKWVSRGSNGGGVKPVTTYTVTFDSQGGSSIGAFAGITYGSTIAAPSDPERSGYVFKGWYKEPSCTNAWDFESDAVTSDITLYAKWTWVDKNNSDNDNEDNMPAPNNPDKDSDSMPAPNNPDDNHAGTIPGSPTGDPEDTASPDAMSPDQKETTAGDSELDDSPQTGEIDAPWELHIFLMLVSLAILGILICRDKQMQKSGRGGSHEQV